MTETIEEPIQQGNRKTGVKDKSNLTLNTIGSGSDLDPNSFDSSLTNYLDYFGLSLDPFEANFSPLFQGGEREAMLSQLLHLSQFSSSISVVIGEPGVGKTCFRYALLEYLESQDLVCELEIPAISNLDQILLDISRQFGLQEAKDAGDSEQLFNLIQQFGAQAEENDPLKLICIDDAHHLDDFSLERLIELAQPVMEEHRHIHLVFFGEPDLRERFSAINKKKTAANQALLFQFLLVKPLSLVELKEYLRFRLDNVGFDGLLPFKDEDVQFLWDISQGVPAALNNAAREILIELAMPPLNNKSIGLPPAHMTLVAVLVVGLLIAVFYQSRNEDDQLSLNPESELILGDQQGVQEVAVISEQVNPASVVTSPASNLEAVPVPQSIDQVPQVNIKIPTPSFESSPTLTVEAEATRVVRDDVAVPEAVDAVSADLVATSPVPVDQVPGPQPLQTEKPASQVVQNAESPRTQNVPSNEAVLLSVAETALLNKPSEAFTLQILAASSLAAAEDFIGRQSNAKDLVVYPARRNSKTVYIIVAGNYSTLVLARNAIKTLPSAQQETGPWPRAFASVQSDIREFREL